MWRLFLLRSFLEIKSILLSRYKNDNRDKNNVLRRSQADLGQAISSPIEEQGGLQAEIESSMQFLCTP